MNGLASDASTNDFCEMQITTSNFRALREILGTIDRAAGMALATLSQLALRLTLEAAPGIGQTEYLIRRSRSIDSNDPCWRSMTYTESLTVSHRVIILNSAPPGSPT